MKKRIEESIAEHLAVFEKFQDSCADTIESIAARCIESLQSGGKVCFFGNGGSAADAQHFATEFVVRFVENRRSIPAIAFTTDTSILTACANDFGYDEVFARQVEGLCGPEDVVIGISTSGSSTNVVRGLETARDLGITTVAFTGRDAGPCGNRADLVLCAPSEVTARIQECHLLAGHILCDLVEQAFLNGGPTS